MRKAVVILFCLFSIQFVTGQEEEAYNQVKLAVKTPAKYVEGLKESHTRKLANKIQRMVTNYGVSSLNYVQDFMIYPEYEIYDSSELQTGMGKVYSIEANLTLKIIDIKTLSLISTYTTELKGEDYGSKDKAITKSISRLKTRNNEIEEFIKTSKIKILNYYKTNCNKIYSDASVMIQNDQLEKAITLLQTVPRNLTGSCFEKIVKLQKKALVLYKEKNCIEIIKEAEKAIKDEKTFYAKVLLKQVSVKSNCYEDANEFLSRLDTTNRVEKESPKVNEIVKTYNGKLTKEVAESTSKEQEANLMCINFGENCN